MARLVVEEQKDIPTLPKDSIIQVMVERADIRTVQGPRGDWDKIEFKFKVLAVQSVPGDHPGNYENLIGEYIYGSTPARITDSQENKLRLWAEAIFNRPMALGEELDTDYFLRREVRAVTSTYEKRAINPVTRKPFEGHQVASLLPMGTGQGVVPGQLQQAPVQQAPQSWGGSGYVPQQQAPQQAPVQQQPPAADPWATPQQGQWAQQGGFEDEPPF